MRPEGAHQRQLMNRNGRIRKLALDVFGRARHEQGIEIGSELLRQKKRLTGRSTDVESRDDSKNREPLGQPRIALSIRRVYRNPP